mmetsp:Transcript_10432/g.8966  ORF Transcript_10432/g.8966 Transcript_10432/m.8966 type:complete len:121 (+) Transcript_10432:3901-4263(+)
MESLWQLFFMIYDVEKHFLKTDLTDQKEKFKTNFLEKKTDEIDIYFKCKEDAINRNFQKVFKILNTYKSLIKSFKWILPTKDNSESMRKKKRILTRLTVMILIVFLNKNRENQEAVSNDR